MLTARSIFRTVFRLSRDSKSLGVLAVSIVAHVRRQPDATPGAVVTHTRLFWCCMLLLHVAAVPPLLAGLGGGSESHAELSALARLLGLSASAVFFVLKIIDVPRLRMKPGWRSRATAILVIALLHVGVVERAVEGEVELSAAHPGVVLFAAAAWRFDALRHGLRRLLVDSVPIRLLRRRDHLGGMFRGRSLEWAFMPLLLFFVPSYAGPRAPPCHLTTF